MTVVNIALSVNSYSLFLCVYLTVHFLQLENKKNITVKLIILLPISRILTMCTTNWKTTVLWFYVKGTRKHNIEFIGQAVSYFE